MVLSQGLPVITWLNTTDSSDFKAEGDNLTDSKSVVQEATDYQPPVIDESGSMASDPDSKVSGHVLGRVPSPKLYYHEKLLPQQLKKRKCSFSKAKNSDYITVCSVSTLQTRNNSLASLICAPVIAYFKFPRFFCRIIGPSVWTAFCEILWCLTEGWSWTSFSIPAPNFSG